MQKAVGYDLGMTPAAPPIPRLEPKPLPANLTSVQPGGGVVYQLELTWGRLRRWYLRRYHADYVARMAALAWGSFDGCPHEILDPRDLKYCRNQCSGGWDVADDPFTWRDNLPFARWGLAELQCLGWPLLIATIALSAVHWILAVPTAVVLGLVVWFFRDPPRRVPADPDVVVAPADGIVTEITHLDHDEFIGGPAVRIGIFLSIFDVHLNRAPLTSRVIELRYSPGKFISATAPESSLVNENLWIGLEEEEPPRRRAIVRQIAGMFARRIVCALRPGEVVAAGARIGMIKLGSRTELTLPAEPGLSVQVAVGTRVLGGTTIMARWREAGAAPE